MRNFFLLSNLCQENRTYENLDYEELTSKKVFDILNLADEEAVVKLTELHPNGNSKQTWLARMTSKVVSSEKQKRNQLFWTEFPGDSKKSVQNALPDGERVQKVAARSL